MARVFGYIRYGGDDSASLEGQRQNIESYCQTHDHDLVRVYIDREPGSDRGGASDQVMVRAGLQEMLADLRDCPIERVVVFNTSRLWRTDVTKVLIYRELQRHQVDVNAIAQPTFSIYTPGRDSSWYWTEGMLDLLEQYEQMSAALRLRRGRLRKANDGGYAGGRPPFGYKVCKETNRLVVDVSKAQVVRRVFELSEDQPPGSGNLSLQQIADHLNTEGFTTAHGRPFQRVQVKRILDRREFYRGQYSYAGIESSGSHEPLLQVT